MATREVTASNFSLFIAYVLPGFTAMEGLPILAGTTGAWGTGGMGGSPTLSEFLSGTVETVAVGLTVSAVRWLVVDAVHHRTGLRPPAWDFAALAQNADAFELLIQIHYSGRRGVLPRPSPLRTGHATFTASGSSKSLTTRIQT